MSKQDANTEERARHQNAAQDSLSSIQCRSGATNAADISCFRGHRPHPAQILSMSHKDLGKFRDAGQKIPG